MNIDRVTLLLKLTNGITDSTLRKLLQSSSFQKIKSDNEEILQFIKTHNYCFQKVEDYRKINIDSLKIAENKLEFAESQMKKIGINYISYFNKLYPQRFKDMANSKTHDFPTIIYYKGDINLLNSRKTCAIVGSREASIKATKICAQLTKLMVKHDYTIVSGLAKGCDSVAHRSCIDAKGKTIAIVGTGLNIIYPKENEDLFNEIINNGGLIISEYPIGFKVTAYSFVQRDRLQASLSDIVIPIQTSIDGGTLHTCKFSTTYNKKLWVVSPNIINDADTSGNAYLIREYHAKEITDITKLF